MTTSQRNLRAELEAWRDETPKPWKPAVGDSLVGELVRYSQGQGQYGPAWVAHVREESTGEMRAVWIFWEVLKDAFKREQPKPGECIGIRRLEDGAGAQGSYRRFALVVEREGGEALPDFDALGHAADASDVGAAAEGERDNRSDWPPPNPFD